jgi:hypothetical protein
MKNFAPQHLQQRKPTINQAKKNAMIEGLGYGFLHQKAEEKSAIKQDNQFCCASGITNETKKENTFVKEKLNTTSIIALFICGGLAILSGRYIYKAY